MQVLNWNAHRIDEAIAEVHLLLKDAVQVLGILKKNVGRHTHCAGRLGHAAAI